MLSSFFRKKENECKSDFVIEENDGDNEDSLVSNLRVNLSRLIYYAESADTKLQREVAEKLANEAVKPSRQKQIVELGGLQLLIPLLKSDDDEVQRLGTHALANLSVNADNQILMAKNGAIDILIELTNNNKLNELTLRQSCKSLANLGVNYDNKLLIAEKGGIDCLVKVANHKSSLVQVEAIAALANLAVHDKNEEKIISRGALVPILDALGKSIDKLSYIGNLNTTDYRIAEDLATQCMRALRNLCYRAANKEAAIELGACEILFRLVAEKPDEKMGEQARLLLKSLTL